LQIKNYDDLLFFAPNQGSIEMAAFAACEIAVQSDNFIHIRHRGIWMLGVFLVSLFLL
jgi:hypothetical protein